MQKFDTILMLFSNLCNTQLTHTDQTLRRKGHETKPQVIADTTSYISRFREASLAQAPNRPKYF